jgi:hypothetical protein
VVRKGCVRTDGGDPRLSFVAVADSVVTGETGRAEIQSPRGRGQRVDRVSVRSAARESKLEEYIRRGGGMGPGALANSWELGGRR